MNNNSEFLYFTNATCSVCHVLLPKVEAMIKESFPEIKFRVVKIHETPDIAASDMVFAVPTVILKSENVEIYRRSGVFSVYEVEDQLNRIKTLSS